MDETLHVQCAKKLRTTYTVAVIDNENSLHRELADELLRFEANIVREFSSEKQTYDVRTAAPPHSTIPNCCVTVRTSVGRSPNRT